MEGGDDISAGDPYKGHGSLALELGDGGGGSSSSPSSSFSSTGSSHEQADSSPEISLLDEERFFRRLLTREDASSRPGFSSRIYYRAAGKVPFDWEVAPGKPKNPSQASKLPPLCPPPSVHHRDFVFPRGREPEKSSFWFLNASSKRSNGLRRGTTAATGGNKGLPSSTDGRDEHFPATQKELSWPVSGGNSCLPFHFSSVRGRRSVIN